MKKDYYLFNPGRLSRKDNTLKFLPIDEHGNEGEAKFIPIEGIENLFVFGSLDTNSALYNFLGQHHIAVHFFDYYENYTGSFAPREFLHAGKVLVAQTLHYHHAKKRIVIAQKFIDGAISNMLKNLAYYNNRGQDLEGIIEKIKSFQLKVFDTKEIDELMGIEGNARQLYYLAFEVIIKDFSMEGRSKKPPQNEINALISFGNMICYTLCMNQIYNTQLNPTISFLHEPGFRRYSLALDLAEIFKPILVDRVIFKILNKKMLNEKDFDKQLNGCFLKDSGKKVFLEEWKHRLEETIKHRKLNKDVSYKHLVRLECYKLVKHVLGMEEYEPLKMWW